LDIFDKFKDDKGPLGQFSNTQGYFMFPKLEGEISNKMTFRGKECLTWSVNNYLGLANHPEVREVDAKAAQEWGLAYPMGARMMSGHTKYHEQFESEIADFLEKEDAYLLNFGYQGCMSTIDALVDRNDVIVYDSESHACILDGVRMHMGKRFVFAHNDMDNCRKQLERATKLCEKTGGGILLITEGVFGMAGDQGKLKEIVDLRKNEGFNFRLFVDDAHGIGALGPNGKGAAEEQGVLDEIDVLFGTFAKSFASIGAFICATEKVIDYLKYNMRSQIFAKSLPMPLVIGALKRLELIKTQPELREKLWTVATALQNGLKEAGFNIGDTNSCVTPVYMTGGVYEAANMLVEMREEYNIFCSLVLYPVVPKGVILLRLIPTAMHTLDDVEYTIDVFKKVKEKLVAGEYNKEEFGILN